ncbi:MAG: TraR/DksA C4-type zinc finger protein, partial [Chloroflexota bacterium]
MIDQKLREELHERLLQEHGRLEQEITSLSGHGISADTFSENETDSLGQHPADEGSEMFEREKNLTIQRTLE